MRTVVENETSMTEIEVFEDRIVLKVKQKEQPEKASHAYLGTSNKITAGTITADKIAGLKGQMLSDAAIISNLIVPNAQITAGKIGSAEIGHGSLKPIQTESQSDRIEKKVDRILELLECKETSTSIFVDGKVTVMTATNEIDKAFEKISQRFCRI